MSTSALPGKQNQQNIVFLSKGALLFNQNMTLNTLFYISVTWTDSSSSCPFYNCLQ